MHVGLFEVAISRLQLLPHICADVYSAQRILTSPGVSVTRSDDTNDHDQSHPS